MWTVLKSRGAELLGILYSAKSRNAKLAAISELQEILKYAADDPDVLIISGWKTLSGDTNHAAMAEETED